jgi:protein-S-isoprenylcysteine O-methyltransferase Ste14
MSKNTHSQLKKQALSYALMVMIQRVLGLIGFIVSAGTLIFTRGWIFFGMYFLISIITLLTMMKHNALTLSERGKKHTDTPAWDRWLLAVYVPLAFYGIYIAAGLDIRLNGESNINSLFYLGILLYLIASAFGVWSILENEHFESTARIQTDRNQKVITTGPYRYMRHPGYFSIILWAIAVPLIFGSILSAIISLIIIIVIVIRTNLEDCMLQKDLAGYLEYCDIVKYRLIPYIW